MEQVLNKFIDVIVDKYGNSDTQFTYINLVELALKFCKNDNKLNKRGRPKKETGEKKNFWDIVMHFYSLEPTKYLKIKVADDFLKINTGIIGDIDSIRELNFSNNDECTEILKNYIVSFKKKKYEIMYKHESIII